MKPIKSETKLFNNKQVARSLFVFMALFIGIAQTVKADSPSFTYIELEYVASGDFEISDDTRSITVDMDGFALTGSAKLGIFLLQASRLELESEDVFDSQLEDSISTIGIGLTFDLPQTALYGLVRARRDELSISGIFDEELNETSVGLEAGIRFNVTDRFELNANFGTPAGDQGTSFGIGAQFMITKNLGINLKHNSLEIEEEDLGADLQTTSVSLRYSF